MAEKKHGKVIELLTTKFVQAQHILILNAITFENYKNMNNMLLIPQSGSITVTINSQPTTLQLGDICFIPTGATTTVMYGFKPPKIVRPGRITNLVEEYLNFVETDTPEHEGEAFSYITFQANIYGTLHLFDRLNSPVILRGKEQIQELVNLILGESEKAQLGQDYLLQSYTASLAVLLIRYFFATNVFPERLPVLENTSSDAKLGKILAYISANLSGDLSNTKLAEAAGLATPYISQFFKQATGMNLQEYVKMTRLEQSLKLLKNKEAKVKQVSQDVGFKSFAHFCKSFKESYGTPAKKARGRTKGRREPVRGLMRLNPTATSRNMVLRPT